MKRGNHWRGEKKSCKTNNHFFPNEIRVYYNRPKKTTTNSSMNVLESVSFPPSPIGPGALLPHCALLPTRLFGHNGPASCKAPLILFCCAGSYFFSLSLSHRYRSNFQKTALLFRLLRLGTSNIETRAKALPIVRRSQWGAFNFADLQVDISLWRQMQRSPGVKSNEPCSAFRFLLRRSLTFKANSFVISSANIQRRRCVARKKRGEINHRLSLKKWLKWIQVMKCCS